MDAIEIIGGKPLSGEVQVSGSKNATLPQTAAGLRAPGRSVFRGVPDLADIRTLGRLLGNMGARVERDGTTLQVDAEQVAKPEAPYELVKTMRASVLVLGPLVAGSGAPECGCPEAAPSARVPSTSTSKDCSFSEPGSSWRTDTSRPRQRVCGGRGSCSICRPSRGPKI